MGCGDFCVVLALARIANILMMQVRGCVRQRDGVVMWPFALAAGGVCGTNSVSTIYH